MSRHTIVVLVLLLFFHLISLLLFACIFLVILHVVSLLDNVECPTWKKYRILRKLFFIAYQLNIAEMNYGTKH
jgi:hypothetical protein